MFEPPLLLKTVGLVPYLKDVSVSGRSAGCSGRSDWFLKDMCRGGEHETDAETDFLTVSCLCLLLLAHEDWEGWREDVHRAGTRAAGSMAYGDPNREFLCRMSIRVNFLTMLLLLCLLMATVTRYHLLQFQF